MIKKITITTILLYTIIICVQGQNPSTRYYKDKYLSQETSQDKARFSKTIRNNEDGSITQENKDIKKNRLIESYSFKGEEPVGVWIHGTYKTIPDTFNYDFDLIYGGQCSDDPLHIPIKYDLSDDTTIFYIAPKLLSGIELWKYMQNKIVYPQRAKDLEIQGKVYIAFAITEEAKIENIYIERGADINLDKETARLIREMEFATPPMLKGMPQRICFKLPVEFKLN